MRYNGFFTFYQTCTFLKKQPTGVFGNNKCKIHIANNHVFHKLTRHIEIYCHLLHGKIQQVIYFMPISTTDQAADILTKSLHLGPFSSLVTKLGRTILTLV